jgi:N-acetylglucosaminyldiphosphoundecaprenol N-acetyl-beta-D-mannosaminyltransferase
MEPDNPGSGERVTIGGLPTIRVTSPELARMMVRDCLGSRAAKQPPKLVFSSNGQSVSLAGRNPEFRELMLKADIVHADGMSVVFASRLLSGKPLPERIATTDFFHAAAKAGEEDGLRFYFLGGREEVNAEAYARAQTLYTGIEWVGRHHGFFEADEEHALCMEITAAKPDVLWVALGRPKQEIFSVLHRERLAGVGWIKTCGGLFDFLAGVNRRAPEWMQRAGLEWAWRLMHEPRRLFRRYASTNLHAVWRLALYSRSK